MEGWGFAILGDSFLYIDCSNFKSTFLQSKLFSKFWYLGIAENVLSRSRRPTGVEGCGNNVESV